MAALIALHLAAGTLLLATGRRLGHRAALAAAAAPPALTFAWLAFQVPSVRDGATPHQRFTWVASLDVAFSFRLDGFALLMGLVVTGIGTLVLAYSAGYFAPTQPAARRARFAGAFVAFAGSMLGLVLADDVWTLFVFWEATTITSFVLIGLDDDQAAARAAAQRALLVTAAGGLALLGGLAIVSHAAGTTALAGLAGADTSSAVVQVGLVAILVGSFTKSAQVPFSFWLPGAMAAPTPVSAYLHSATMVKAGVLLVGRLAPLFATVGWWRPTLVVVGGATMVMGGIGALRQHDAKLLLAHGTVSQLGFLTVLLGLGHPGATAAGVAVLAAHALFKAPLFLCVGIVDHATGTRDIRRLTGVGRALPGVAMLAGVAGASMAGVPPLFGFVAKEAALDALLEAGDAWSTAALVLVVAGSVLTVAYTVRFWLGTFTAWGSAGNDPAPAHHSPSALLFGPAAVLVALTVLGGVAAEPLGELLGVASESLDHAAHGHLTLWAGFHLPLALSGLVLAGGLGLHLVLSRRGGVPAPRLSGDQVFQRVYDGAIDGARRLTGVVQSGSLPAYVAVVACVLVAALGAAFVVGVDVGPAGTSLGSPLQVAVAGLAMAMAGAIVATRRRFVAVLMLGSVGYGLSALFLLYGAPDLALTQLLVETVSLIAFLLVLRHLPEGYAPPPEWAPRAVRVAIAVAVGVGVAGFALAAGTARTTSPVGDEMVARAEPDGGGRNVVNVILVDIRGIDTLGEITVLGIAAAGVANLVRAARRDRADDDPLGAPDLDASARRVGARSVVFDQVARAAFPVILLVSVYVALRGHNAPGGGFAGGLVAGAAFALRYLAGGSPELRRRALPTTGLVAAGLLLAVGTGLAATLAGDDLLTSAIAHVDVPLVGDVKLVSSTIFDVGVYLLVLGVVLSVLTHLGADAEAVPTTEDRQPGEVTS